eukprot:g2789.t2
MKRLPRKKRWTKTYRKLSGKELADDTTFQMERRRNRPERYNRQLLHTSIKAMKTITEIRKKRQDRFYELRMRRAEKYRRLEARRELKRDVRLVRAEDNLLRQEVKEKLRIPVERTEPNFDEMIDD